MSKKGLIILLICIIVFVIIPSNLFVLFFGATNIFYGFHMENIVAGVLIIFAIAVLPAGLTIWNIVNCVINNVISERISSSATLVFGYLLYITYLMTCYDLSGDWYEAIYPMQYHNTISSEYRICIILIILAGVAGFATLLYTNAKKLPPLASAFAIGAVILLNVFQMAYAIQIFKNAPIESPLEGLKKFFTPNLYLYLYHFNVLLISALAVKRHLIEQLEMLKEETDEKRSVFFKKLYRFMSNIAGYSTIVFIALFFIIAVLEIIFIILGKGPDGAVKAFTDTADWTFSKQIPPPPLEYNGHYLCTVAAGGHKKIVKPLRLGTRRNATIIVNRQLCIANAFEEKIQEISPKFHKFIRGVYDNYGFPLSTIITTPLKADIVYILMKPLEWIFLIFLYMTDVNPEKRIGRQYAYKQ